MELPDGCRTVIKTVEKAEKSQTVLSRILSNVGGPKGYKRALLDVVVQSIVLYGALVLHLVLRYKKYRAKLVQLQKQGLLRVASTYRTVSVEAAQVVSGLVPIDLLIEERVKLYRSGDGHLR